MDPTDAPARWGWRDRELMADPFDRLAATLDHLELEKVTCDQASLALCLLTMLDHPDVNPVRWLSGDTILEAYAALSRWATISEEVAS